MQKYRIFANGNAIKDGGNFRVHISLLSVLMLLTLLGPKSVAQVTSISPFIGQHSETWESFPNYLSQFYLPSPTTIMSGFASITCIDYYTNHQVPAMNVYEPGIAHWGSTFPFGVSDGTKAMGVNGTGVINRITFSTPITNFGAYWGGDPEGPAAEELIPINLFAAGTNQLIWSDSIIYTGNGILQWQGWHSDVQIGSLTFGFGIPTVMDGLQASLVQPSGGTTPEPSSASVFVLMVGSASILFFHRIKRHI